MSLNELFETINLSIENNFNRTITNLRVQFVKPDINTILYNEIKSDIKMHNRYINTKLSNIKSISEIKLCITSKHSNKIITFINPNNIKCEPVTYIKNIDVIISQHGINSDILKNHLLKNKTSFDSYIKKKKNKNKKSIKLLKSTRHDSYAIINNRYNISEISKCAKTHEINIKSMIIFEIYEDKIISAGRMLLPNSICILLNNNVRLIIYKHNDKLQLLLPKQKNNNMETFKYLITISLSFILELLNLYITPIEDILSHIYSVGMYIDFNYISDNVLSVLPINKYNNVKFYGKNKLSIKSVQSYHELLEYINILKKYNNYWNKINKLLDDIPDPFSSQDNVLINLIENIEYHL